MAVWFFWSVKSTGRETDREVPSVAPGAQMMSAKQKNGCPTSDFSNPFRRLAHNETT